MIRRSSSRTLQTTEQLKAKRVRRDAGTSSGEAPLTAATAGQLAITLLNAGDLTTFTQLLETMRQAGIRKLDLSHRPQLQGTPAAPTLITELGMRTLATAFEQHHMSGIQELDFAGAHVVRLQPFLQALEVVKGWALKRMDFSGTKVLNNGKLYFLQAHHFQLIAQIVANAPWMESLALNDQPLLKGQKAGTVQTLPKPVQHLERYTVELTDADVPGSLPELRNAVCAATQRNFHLLELRACNLNDDDLSLLWPVIDTSAPIEVQLKTPRRQLNSLDLRSNPLMSYGNRLVMLSKALTPDGALQALYLPSHFDKVYAQLYEHDRLSFHERLAKSRLQILEPLSSSQDPEFDLVKGALAARRTSLDVPVAAEPEVPPFDLSRVTDVDPLSFV